MPARPGQPAERAAGRGALSRTCADGAHSSRLRAPSFSGSTTTAARSSARAGLARAPRLFFSRFALCPPAPAGGGWHTGVACQVANIAPKRDCCLAAQHCAGDAGRRQVGSVRPAPVLAASLRSPDPHFRRDADWLGPAGLERASRNPAPSSPLCGLDAACHRGRSACCSTLHSSCGERGGRGVAGA